MNLKTKRQPNKSMRTRSYLLVFLFTVTFAAILVCHLFKISVIDHDIYVARANERHFGNISIPAERGAIYEKKLKKIINRYLHRINPMTRHQRDMLTQHSFRMNL